MIIMFIIMQYISLELLVNLHLSSSVTSCIAVSDVI